MKNFSNHLTLRFNGMRNFLATCLTFLFVLCLLLGVGVNRVEAQVTFNLQDNPSTWNTKLTYVGSSGGSAGTYNNVGASPNGTLGMYSNQGGCVGGTTSGTSTLPQVVYFETLTTTGTSGGTARNLQVGDSITILGNITNSAGGSNSFCASTGACGISFNNNTTYSAISNYNTSQIANFQIVKSGTWTSTPSAGAATIPTGGNSSLNTYSIKITSPTTANIYMKAFSGATEETFDNVITNFPIKSFALYSFGTGTSNDNFWKNLTVFSTGIINLGVGGGTSTISSVIPNGLAANSTSTVTVNNLNKTGAGNITLGAANTYTGTTTVTAGTLTVGIANAIPTGSVGNVILSGGTLNTAPAATPAGFNDGVSGTPMGVLILNNNATIALGTSNSIYFANSSGGTWTASKTLTITGWTGTAGGTGSGAHIFVGSGAGSLTTAQLLEVTFSGYSPGAAILSGTGELVPSASTAAVITSVGPTTGAAFPGQTALTGNNGYAGQSITITGANLTGATAGGTTIGGVAVTSIVSNNGTTLVVIPAIGSSGTVSVNATANTATSAGFAFLGYITNANTDWNTGSTWLNGSVPPTGAATTVNNAITVNVSNVTASPATIIINSGSSITFGAFSLTATTGITSSGAITTASGSLLTSPTITLNTGATLTLGAANTVAGTTNLVLSGGTLSTGSPTGYSNSFANINMTASSAITFVSAGNASPNQQLSFATTSATWTGTLTINNWQGTAGGSGNDGQIFVGSGSSVLSTAEKAQILIGGFAATQLGTGEVTPFSPPANAGIWDSYITIGGTQFYLGTSGTIPSGGTFPLTHTNVSGAPAFQGDNLNTQLGSFPANTAVNITAASFYDWRANNGALGNICGSSVINWSVLNSLSVSVASGSFGIGNFSTTTTPTSGAGVTYLNQLLTGTGTGNIVGSLASGNYTLMVDISVQGDNTNPGNCNNNAFYVPSTAPTTQLTASFTISCVTPTVTVNSPSICGAGSATLTASGATTYTWTPNTNLSATTGASVTANPASTTTYTVTGASGTCSTTATSVVSVGTTPSVSVNTPAAFCGGGNATLTASGATTYAWTPTTGLSAATGASVTASPTATTTYTVTGTTSGCSTTAASVVTVNPAPSLSATSPSFCSGSTNGLIASCSANCSGTYSWSPATGLSATTGSNPTASPTVTTTYTVSSSLGGCTSTATGVVTVSIGGWLGGSNGNDWNTMANWCGGIPTSTTDVVIPTGANQPVITSADAVCHSITLSSGASNPTSLTMTNGHTLTISSGGFFTNSSNNGGAALIQGTGSNAVIFAGTGTITGPVNFTNLSLQNGAVGLGASSAIAITNTLTLGNGSNSGTLTLAGNSISVSALATSGSGSANTIQDAGANATLTITGALTSSFSGKIINGSSGLLALVISGSSNLTLSGANTFTGGITLNTGATLVLGATNTINSSSNNLTFAGGTLQTGPSTTGFASSFGNIVISANSTINLAGTNNHQIKFNGLGTLSALLSINNWQGSAGANTAGTGGQVIVGSGSSLGSNIGLFTVNGVQSVQLASAEVVPTIPGEGAFDSYLYIGTSTPASFTAANYYLGTTGYQPCVNLLSNTLGKTSFNGATLAGSPFAAGGTLTFYGGVFYGWKTSGNICLSGQVYYRIYSSTGTPGAFTALPTGIGSESSLSPTPTCSGASLNPYYTFSNSLNILSGLTPGTYTLEVYMQSYTGQCSGNYPFYINGLGVPGGVSGNNYKATFVVAGNAGVYDSYVFLGGATSSTPTYFLGTSAAASGVPTPAGCNLASNALAKPALDGANLGNFGFNTSSISSTLYGATENVWHAVSGQGNVCGGTIYYRIWSTAGSPGSFVALNTLNSGSSPCSSLSNIAVQSWANPANASINILNPTGSSALPQGTYNLQVYISTTGDPIANNCNVGGILVNGLPNNTAGNYYTAQFSIGPAISTVVPTTPLISGQANNTGYTGQTLTITGAAFTGATAVSIGGVAATSFSVTDDAHITAVVGPAAGGSTIAITGSTGVTTTAAFTYLGYLSQAAGNWSSAGSWLGTTFVPAAGYPVTIASNVTLDGAATANPSSLTINSGFTFTASDASPETLTISASASATTLTVVSGGVWANGLGGSTVIFTCPSSAPATVTHTISGTVAFNNVSVGRLVFATGPVVSLNFGTAGTVLNNYSINNGGSTSTNPPIYGTNSTLIYNTGNTYTITSGTVEWVGTLTSGAGVPRNVQVGTSAVNNSILSFGSVSTIYQVQGNLTVGAATGSGYGMTLSSNSGFTLNVGGDYTLQNIAGGTVINNNRGVQFNGSTAIQHIQYVGGGTVFFDYLILANPNWNLQLATGTNVTITYASQGTATIFQMLNNMQLDLNGQVFTMNGNAGAQIQVNFVGRTITSSVAGGIFAIYANTMVVNIASVGTLNIGVTGANSSNTTLQLNSGFDCGAALTFIYGTLQIQNNGSILNNSPTYEPASLLDYNTGGTFQRHLEWNAATPVSPATTAQGYPYNVTINTGTTLDPSNAGAYVSQAFNMGGDLSIFGNLFMDASDGNMLVTLNVGGSILINGMLSASGLSGGDVALQGNWTNNGTFTTHWSPTTPGRLVTFFGTTATRTIGGSSITPFAFLAINKPSGGVTLTNAITVSNDLKLTTGTVTLGNNNITLFSGSTLTAGSAFSSTNMVVTNGTGQFIWSLPVISSPTTYIYPVGDATPNYTPATLTFASNSAPGKLGVNVVNSMENHMNTPTAPAAFLQRYWTFGNNNLANYTYTGTFKYVAGDVSGPPAKIQLASWVGSAWAPYYGSSAASNTLTETETLTQATAALIGDFTGRTGILAAYAVTGDTACGSNTIGLASSQDNVSYQLYANAASTGSPVTSTATGSAISFGVKNTAGTYTVVATDVNGSTLAMTGSALINPLPNLSIDESDNSGSFANDAKICNLDAVTLSGNPSTGLTYSWSAGLGTNQTVTDNPSTSTTYTVSVTDVNGCTATANKAITVNTLPPVLVTPASAVCTGFTTAVLTASGATGYTWAPSTNLTSTNGGVTETAQISVITFYTVTGTDANRCSANVVVPVATVPIGGTATPVFSIICSGGTKTLTVNGAAGSDYQWQVSTDNAIWTNITGATNTTYTTTNSTANKFYRMLAQSSCWNVASTTAEVDISNPVIAITATNITDNSLTLNWSPTGTGNYTISYSGTSSATQTSITPAKTITGLSSNGSYTIVVTQTGVAGCSASGTLTGVNTLCAMPTGVTVSSPANAQILVSWTGVGGANYRVYYRPLFAFGYYFTKDVSGVSSALITKQGNNNIYGSTTYEVYVSRLDCPGTGTVGQGTNPINVTTLPIVSCPTPVIDSVRSLCPVQIEVFMHPGSSPTGTYNIYLQRITPTILAVNSYGVTGNYFTINVPYSGDVYLIAADSKCSGGALSSLYVYPGNVTVKPLCTSPANLVLSNATCHGFTGSWNADQCLSNSASSYNIYLRVAGTINYNSYGVSLPANGIGPNDRINWLTSGRNYQVFVRSVYNCNGFTTYGPPSQTQTITTLSSGCRDEEDVQPQATQPSVQQYSPDNQEVFSLYPNPNNGEFVVDLSRFNMEENAVRVEVINMIGQMVVTHLTTISGGHMSEFINLPNSVAAGTYIVRLTAGKNVYTAKVNVSK